VVVKVCFVTANYPPEVLGGTEQVVTALARELRARAIDVVVITGSDEPYAGNDVTREAHEEVAVHRVRRFPDEADHRGFVRPRLLALVRESIARERPDVLHVHSLAGFGGGINAIARELGIPVVMTFHDLYVVCARYFRVPVGGVSCPVGTDRTPCVTCVNHTLHTDPVIVWAALAERDRVMREEIALADACTVPSRTAAEFIRDGLPYPGRFEVIPHGLLRPVPADERASPPAQGELLSPRCRVSCTCVAACMAARSCCVCGSASDKVCGACHTVPTGPSGAIPRATCTSRCSPASARRPMASSSTKRSPTVFPRWYRMQVRCVNAEASPASS
jgi:hypothetical protein